MSTLISEIDSAGPHKRTRTDGVMNQDLRGGDRYIQEHMAARQQQIKNYSYRHTKMKPQSLPMPAQDLLWSANFAEAIPDMVHLGHADRAPPNRHRRWRARRALLVSPIWRRWRREGLPLPLARLPRVAHRGRVRDQLQKSAKRRRGAERAAAHLVFSHAVDDAVYDAVDDVAVVPVRLVVAKAHVLPPLALGVPVDLHDPVVVLRAGRLDPGAVCQRGPRESGAERTRPIRPRRARGRRSTRTAARRTTLAVRTAAPRARSLRFVAAARAGSALRA